MELHPDVLSAQRLKNEVLVCRETVRAQQDHEKMLGMPDPLRKRRQLEEARP